MPQINACLAKLRTSPRLSASVAQADAMVAFLAEGFLLTSEQDRALFQALADCIEQNALEFPLPAAPSSNLAGSIFCARRPSLVAHS